MWKPHYQEKTLNSLQRPRVWPVALTKHFRIQLRWPWTFSDGCFWFVLCFWFANHQPSNWLYTLLWTVSRWANIWPVFLQSNEETCSPMAVTFAKSQINPASCFWYPGSWFWNPTPIIVIASLSRNKPYSSQRPRVWPRCVIKAKTYPVTITLNIEWRAFLFCNMFLMRKLSASNGLYTML